MTTIPAHNPLDQPVVIDADGRQLGGGEWGTVDPDVYAVQAAVDAHRLIIFPGGLPGDVDPEIRAAVEGRSTDDASAVVNDDDSVAEAPAIPSSPKTRSTSR